MNKFLFRLLRLTGLPLIFREIIQRNKVTILLLHDISIETAETIFNYILKKYAIIDLDDYIKAVEEKISLPKKSIIFTFDDGYIRNYELLPIIKKKNIPITIFLCSSIINTKRHFWFKYKSNKPLEKLKHISNKERLEVLSKLGFEQEKEYDTFQTLQKSHINEMKNFVNFQSHTLFHPILPKCDMEEARREIVESKKNLEKKYNLKIKAISYPNGDYSEREINIAKKAGYKCGITVDFGYNNLNSDLFRLKRLSVNDTNDINELIVKASGLWAFLKTRNGRKQEYGYTN